MLVHCLTLEHWKDLIHLPIVRINGSSGGIIAHEFDEYDSLIGQIHPTPAFHLLEGYTYIIPEDLLKFRQIRITSLATSTFKYSARFDDYLAALQANNQSPIINIKTASSRGLSLDNLQKILSQYRVGYIHWSVLPRNAASDLLDQYIDLITSHHKRIQEFNLQRHSMGAIKHLTQAHCEKLRAVRLISDERYQNIFEREDNK